MDAGVVAVPPLVTQRHLGRALTVLHAPAREADGDVEATPSMVVIDTRPSDPRHRRAPPGARQIRASVAAVRPLLVATEVSKRPAEVVPRRALSVKSKPVMLWVDELVLPSLKGRPGGAELPVSSGNGGCCRCHLRNSWGPFVEATQHDRPVSNPQFDERVANPESASREATGIQQLPIPAWRVQDNSPALLQQVLSKRQCRAVCHGACGCYGYTRTDDRALQDVCVDDNEFCGLRDGSREPGLA